MRLPRPRMPVRDYEIGPLLDVLLITAVATILARESIKPIQKQAALRGIADKMVVYEIP